MVFLNDLNELEISSSNIYFNMKEKFNLNNLQQFRSL